MMFATPARRAFKKAKFGESLLLLRAHRKCRTTGYSRPKPVLADAGQISLTECAFLKNHSHILF